MASLPRTMSAAVLKGPGQIDVDQVPVPSVGPDDVLVAVELCGICGTDLHMVLEGWGRPGSWPGHEWIGQVAAVGNNVERWRAGDVVVGGPSLRCGTCAMCRTGRPSLCAERDSPGMSDQQGAFANFVRAGADELLAIPHGLDRRAAALAEPLAVALHAITLSGAAAANRAMVLGAGPIGALTIAALRARGIDEVICSEPAETRQTLATAVGATKVVHPDDLRVPSIAEPGLILDDAVDVVFECSGKAKAMEAGLAQLVRGGRLVLVGSGIEPPRFDPNRILLNELIVTGAFNYDHDGFERALEMLASGSLPVESLLERDEVPLSGVLDAMRGLVDGRLAGKVLVRP